MQKLLQQFKLLKTQLDETAEMLRLFGVTNVDEEQQTENLSKTEASSDVYSSATLNKLNVSRLIRIAAQEQGGSPFTRADLGRWIYSKTGRERLKLVSLSALVSTIARNDDWEVVTEGGGGKLTSYRLKKPYSPSLVTRGR